MLEAMLPEVHKVCSPQEMEVLAQGCLGLLGEGEVVLLSGPLGVGKTTWVRGLLRGLGWQGAVRSPSFNLMQSFETTPRVLHADLYRVHHAHDLGLEEYLGSHLCLIEWPENLAGFVDPTTCWRVEMRFAENGRVVTVYPPDRSP